MLLSIGYCPVKFNFRMENNLVQESAIDQSPPELIEGDITFGIAIHRL